MLYVGLDLSRKRLDYHASLADGAVTAVGAARRTGTGSRISCTAWERRGRCWRRSNR
jgi:hypothetical protein